MNYGSSKSAEMVLSKSIFYVKNRQNFFKENLAFLGPTIFKIPQPN